MKFFVFVFLCAIKCTIISDSAAAQDIQRSNKEIMLDMKTDDYSNDIGLEGEHELTRLEARRIARQAGVIDIDMVKRHGIHVVVDGTDENGDDITVLIDRRSGRVAQIKK
ncbi:hypothetical protein ACFZ8E_14700 [Methylobacterium sp. HMF5984]|uniref:hypothetical protein n=1 Tax=Methylobacterium sp. HMF5984 TaxID=3367370 RepID=UPI0038521B1A